MQNTSDQALNYYARPTHMTSAGPNQEHFDGLPRDLPGLVATVQGLMLHVHWAPAYGVELSEDRHAEAHLRPTELMLDRLLSTSDRALTKSRTLDQRIVGTCRDFSVLLIAMLRSQGTPARARCGFATYFGTPGAEDHWVAEYWNANESRWTLVDAQIDDLQRGHLQIDFDLFDVPRDKFVIAGAAWAASRAGKADPDGFGLSFLDEGGYWFIAGNLIRDVAALNNMEMLPWDMWGAMPEPNAVMNDEEMTFFDRLATLTHSPDIGFAELRSLYDGDDRLRVPSVVHNAVLNREDTV